ncbi:MAG: retroviral-like aspartic protease family protein [Thermosynechococcaceae cyanobacterium MS004]|nr:retroviral-like aspartic protease family protein [Thermosynechococcaceae cyanobacterium MS004]
MLRPLALTGSQSAARTGARVYVIALLSGLPADLVLAQQKLPPTLLEQVQACILAQSRGDSPPLPGFTQKPENAVTGDSAKRTVMPTQVMPTQEVAERCIFSVVMLHPNGSVRPDAGDRLAQLMRQTGAKMPRPQGQGQTTLSFQTQPGQKLYRVPVTIQKQQFSFLLDTGASNTVIDHQIARQLKLVGQPAPPDLLGYVAVGQEPKLQSPILYTLPPLTLGQTRVSQLRGLGLSTQQPPFSSDGILGLDFLSQFDLVIRPQQKSLSLLRPSAPVARGIPLKGSLGVMTTSAIAINGRGSYTFLLDTGAAITTLSRPLSQRLGLKLKPQDGVQVMGLGGRIEARWSRLDSLALQTHRLTNHDVLVADSQVFQTLGVDGVIGQDVLSQFDQHWRFGAPGALGVPDHGSLELVPVRQDVKL